MCITNPGIRTAADQTANPADQDHILNQRKIEVRNLTFRAMPPVEAPEALPELVRRRRRLMWTVILLALVLLIVSTVGVGAWLWSEITPNFPDPPPEPPGSTNVRTTTGYDTDDPVAYTASVVDFPEGTQSLYAFYRTSFSESAGWAGQPPPTKDSLCLVNTTNAGSIRVLEARPFEGSPELRQPNRFLVISSDFDGNHWKNPGICGAVNAWLDCDIETWYLEKKDGSLIPCYEKDSRGDGAT